MLGGGGVRGLAHVGVLAALARAKIEPDVLVGVSMGALVATTYAARDDWMAALESVDRSRLPALTDPRDDIALARMRTLVRNARRLAPSVWTWGRQGYEDYGRATLATLLGEAQTFAECRVPVAVIATDLDRRERVVFNDGDLIGATLASGAIPGLARPVVLDGRTLIDGGFSDPAPVDVARDMGADVVVAVHTGQRYAEFEADNWAMALLRGIDVAQRALATERLRHADLVLRPEFADRVNLLNFSAVSDVVRAGVTEVRGQLPRLRALLAMADASLASPEGGDQTG
ncbi:patatin family protein [soil metagenome]